MTYTSRAAMAVGDVYTAADQNDSAANDDHLHNALLGPIPPAATGGMVRQWVQETGIADATATEFCTITTTNEAGDNDGGSYAAVFEGLVYHGVGAGGANACMGIRVQFCRSVGASGATGVTSAVVSSDTTAVGANVAATKTITTAVITTAETSEYITSVLANIDLAGTDVTTGQIYGMMTVYYVGFLTAPVITSAG